VQHQALHAPGYVVARSLLKACAMATSPFHVQLCKRFNLCRKYNMCRKIQSMMTREQYMVGHLFPGSSVKLKAPSAFFDPLTGRLVALIPSKSVVHAAHDADCISCFEQDTWRLRRVGVRAYYIVTCCGAVLQSYDGTSNSVEHRSCLRPNEPSGMVAEEYEG